MPIILNNMGNYDIDAKKYGNLVLIVDEVEHSKYVRNGTNLRRKIPINLKDALCGNKFTFKHLDGKKVNIILDKVISPNETKEIPEMGMKKMNGARGKLILEYIIKFPNKLNEKSKNKLREIL